MTAQSQTPNGNKVGTSTGLDLLRAPFPANQISKLPKPTKRQTEEVRNDFKKGIRCKLCGAWHHPQVVHLDYVGHAALTDRLLDCDPEWNWEPVATTEHGTPMTDENGGMWIRLTVCGVTRLGYGHPDGKRGGDAIKELIGDAMRNAAMRFGAALDLWHKGDLHGADEIADESDDNATGDAPPKAEQAAGPSPQEIEAAKQGLFNSADMDALKAAWGALPKPVQHVQAVIDAKDGRKAELSAHPEQPLADDLGGDEIPY